MSTIFEQEVAAVAKGIHDLVNRDMSGEKSRALAQALATDHRTLVQSTMRELILPFIAILAQQGHDERYDLRNEGSVKVAMEIEQMLASSEVILPFV